MGLGLCVGACDVADDPGASFDPALVDEGPRGQVDNAQVLNSAVLNGERLNGIQLNGIQFNGIQFNGIQFNGIQFNGVHLEESVLAGTIDLGDGPEPRIGPDFVGATMSLVAGSTEYTLRFDEIYENPGQPGSGVWFHKVYIREGEDGDWQSLCYDNLGQPTDSVLLKNAWDYTTGARIDNPSAMTIACRHAVLAKCVEWGYIPWQTATMCDENGQNCAPTSLADHHQACTRMARADYCGNGHSYTFNGTPIDVYDALTPRLQTSSSTGLTGWGVEAEWGPDGANCVGDELRMTMYDEHGVPYETPECLSELSAVPNCGSMPATRPTSKISNAYCNQWETDASACEAHNDDP
ncbi:MAG: hypothetical protein JNL82_18695 [Myxococcales bacterium]|nr:hypothetical protein [Myxococcales bacterium]